MIDKFKFDSHIMFLSCITLLQVTVYQDVRLFCAHCNTGGTPAYFSPYRHAATQIDGLCPFLPSTYLSSLPILAVVYRFFTFLPPTYRFTTIYRFLPIFSRIYRILIFSKVNYAQSTDFYRFFRGSTEF